MARWKAATKALKKKLLAARVGPEREAKRKFLAALGVVGAWARGRVRERREEPAFSREELAIICCSAGKSPSNPRG